MNPEFPVFMPSLSASRLPGRNDADLEESGGLIRSLVDPDGGGTGTGTIGYDNA
jgi:hypothetical protein